MFKILETFSICECDQGCTKKYILKFERREISSNEEYKYCKNLYSNMLYEAGLRGKQYDFLIDDVRFLLMALEKATDMEEVEEE